MRTIFEFSAENAKIEDWVAERVEFELSADFVRDLQVIKLRQFGAIFFST